MATEVNKILLEVEFDAKGVIKNADQINAKLKGLGINAKLAQKGFSDMNSAAGIAGSTVTEFGRLVSDLPYGIQGIANNLSQLGSMFALLTVEASKMNNGLSTTKNTIKLLWAQITGPVGILVAFQAVIAALDYFSRKTKEANKELEQFNDNVIFQTKGASDFLGILEDENIANEKKVQIIRGLAAANKDLKKAIDAGGDPLQVTVDYLRNLNEEVKLRERLLSLEKQFSTEYKDINPTREQYAKNEARITELTTGRAKITGRALTFELDRLEKQNKAIKEIIDLRVEEAAIIARRSELFEEGFEFVPEDFSIFDDESIFEIDPKYEAKLKEDVAKILEDTVGYFNLSEAFKPEPYFPFLDPDDVEAQAEIDEYFDRLQKMFDYKQKKLAEKIDTIDTVVKGLGSINEILNAQAEREIAIEQNKTTRLNDELKTRLANEQLSADQRDKINQQIARNDANLVEIQNDIARKQFKRDKAFKIAMAIGDTASSALKAYSSQLLPFDPTSVGRAQIAAGIATAFGLAQVAALTRLKYTEQGLPSPNLTSQGGGTGAGGEAPQFNVVGAAGQNQLAAAIASTQGEPVKAYVVAGDVTTAQQLDRNIIQGASIG
jgi:hypothetical protein